MPIEVKCQQCGEIFETYPSTLKKGGGKYCSKECYLNSLSGKVEVKCFTCGKSFMVYPSRIKKGWKLYCSKECSGKSYRKVIRTCIICGKSFEVRKAIVDKNGGKYCSNKCRGLGRRNQVEKICKYCGKKFLIAPSNIKKGGGKYCSNECRYKDKREISFKTNCKFCGKEFIVKQYRLEKGEGIFCSQKCFIDNLKNKNFEKNKKECEYCGGFFVSQNKSARFCSRTCYLSYNEKSRKTKIIRQCLRCGTSFKVLKSSRKRYCGECRPKKIIKIKKPNMSCEYCGKPFYIKPYQLEKGRRFCSEKCYGLYQRKRIKRVCDACGKEFWVHPVILKRDGKRGRFCSMKCYSREYRPLWNDGSSYEPYSQEFNKYIKKYIKDRDDYTCQICFKELKDDGDISIHHIDYDKKNSKPDNLICLCFSCHGKSNFNRKYYQIILTEYMNLYIGGEFQMIN